MNTDLTGTALGHCAAVLLHTNHTPSRGARKVEVPLFEKVLPRHLEIVYQINDDFLRVR